MGKSAAWAIGFGMFVAACGGCQQRPPPPPPEPPPLIPLPPPQPTVVPSSMTPLSSATPTTRPTAESRAVPQQPALSPARSVTSPPQWIQPPTGQPCRVLLRRDALGSAAPAPLGVQSPSPASRSAELTGTIDQLSDDWLVLHSGGRLWWIPRGVILAIDFGDAP